MRVRLFLTLILIMFLSSCNRNDEANGNVLIVTIEPYRFLVETIAGDMWVVKTVVPKGNNPETFDPTPRDMLSVSGSKAYFMVGDLGFEKVWKDDITELYPSMEVIDTSQGIERCAGDPHLWTSPDNMSIIAHNVCEALCSLDSTGVVGYRKRLNSFNAMLDRTDSLINEQLKYSKEKSFLIYHPTLTYFANRYGFEQITIEHEGKEASLAHLRSVIDEAKDKEVKHILVQTDFDSKNSEVIANEIDADIYTIDPLSYDWCGQMFHIANIFSQKNRIQ